MLKAHTNRNITDTKQVQITAQNAPHWERFFVVRSAADLCFLLRSPLQAMDGRAGISVDFIQQHIVCKKSFGLMRSEESIIGVPKPVIGVPNLNDGVQDLKDGVQDLNDGVQDRKFGVPNLKFGVIQPKRWGSRPQRWGSEPK
ncbi:MAG: hypothetical protein J0I53_04495 [Chryseobacterium sp.]|nr:hypothetical protein [Chryseobacterium sp.]